MAREVCTIDVPHTSALGEACTTLISQVTNIVSPQVKRLSRPLVRPVSLCTCHIVLVLSDACLCVIARLSIDPLSVYFIHTRHLFIYVYLSVHPSYVSTCVLLVVHVVPFFTNRFLIVQINALLPMGFSHSVISDRYHTWYESKDYRYCCAFVTSLYIRSFFCFAANFSNSCQNVSRTPIISLCAALCPTLSLRLLCRFFFHV